MGDVITDYETTEDPKEGLCEMCGEKPPLEGMTVCQDCLSLLTTGDSAYDPEKESDAAAS